MVNIIKVVELKKVAKYLKSRNLLKQYLKQKDILLSGGLKQIDFKLKNPKSEEVYYFRINRQFRAIGYIEDNIFIVADIDNHQK